MGIYYTLILSQVKDSDEDAISYFCFEAGAAGVSESLDFIQTQDNYEPETLSKEVKTLHVYFEDIPPRVLFEELNQKFPSVVIEQKEEEKKDWREEWKKGLKAFELVDQIWVVPSWLDKPKEAQKIIKIDPGMAFGTGTHETTYLASQMISQVKFKPKDQLLDVGTGTGILALVAAHYGCLKSIGIEIDEPARKVAKENIIHNNRTAEVEILDLELKDVPGTFDVVVANIIDGVLIQLKDQLKLKLKTGGRMILTGILASRRDHFIEHFEWEGFEVLAEEQKGEWVGFHLKKT